MPEDQPESLNGQMYIIKIIIIKTERTKSCDNFLPFAMQDILETDFPSFNHPERMTQVMPDHLKSKNLTKVFPTYPKAVLLYNLTKHNYWT